MKIKSGLQVFLIWYASLALMLTGCSVPAESIDQENMISIKSEVYYAVLNSDYCPKGDFFIYSNTLPFNVGTSGEEWKRLTQRIPTLDRATVDDFNSNNTASQPININLDFRCLFEFSDSQYFSGSFGTGIVFSFSNIGFNPEKTQALVYLEYDCGGECSGGDIFFLEFHDGSWQIVNQLSTFRT